VNSKTVDKSPTLDEVLQDIAMKRNAVMKNEHDQRLTPAQKEIRDRCGNVPRHIRRSIDAYRVARGMVPLWNSSLECGRRTR
jgi:hypothetical protein